MQKNVNDTAMADNIIGYKLVTIAKLNDVVNQIGNRGDKQFVCAAHG